MDNSLDENKVLKREKDILDKQSYNLIEENKVLSSKLTNLENVFIGPSKISELNRSIIGQGELNISKLTNDNLNLRKVLQKTEFEKAELREKASKVENPGMVIKAEDEELAQLTEQNAKLNRRVEFLQKRERELLQTLMQLKYKN